MEFNEVTEVFVVGCELVCQSWAFVFCYVERLCQILLNSSFGSL